MWHTLRQQTGWDLRFSGFINLNHQQDGIAEKRIGWHGGFEDPIGESPVSVCKWFLQLLL